MTLIRLFTPVQNNSLQVSKNQQNCLTVFDPYVVTILIQMQIWAHFLQIWV